MRAKMAMSNSLSSIGDFINRLGQESHDFGNQHGFTNRWDLDAFRHAFSSARLAQQFGYGIAVGMGDLHEIRTPNNPCDQRAMDEHNNRIGARIGADRPSASGSELAGAVANAMRDGSLIRHPNDPRSNKDCDFPPDPPTSMDPLVINLDGRGIKLTDVATSAAYFDFAGDGFRERTAWVAPGTGLVVFDKNANGTIDDGSELFGGPAEDGLAALARFDADGNARIDRNDPIFSQLRIWLDADGDGVTDPGELKTLAPPRRLASRPRYRRSKQAIHGRREGVFKNTRSRRLPMAFRS